QARAAAHELAPVQQPQLANLPGDRAFAGWTAGFDGPDGGRPGAPERSVVAPEDHSGTGANGLLEGAQELQGGIQGGVERELDREARPAVRGPSRQVEPRSRRRIRLLRRLLVQDRVDVGFVDEA